MWRVIRVHRTNIARRLGRRGLLLILSGASWMLIGLDILRHPLHRFTNEHPYPHPNTLLAVFDNPHWGLAWIVCGAVALLMGLLRAHTLARRHDSIGFNAILTPAFLWMLFFGWSAVVSLFTDNQQGKDGQATYSLIVWALVSLFIIVVAGWAEPTENIVLGRPEDEGERR